MNRCLAIGILFFGLLLNCGKHYEKDIAFDLELLRDSPKEIIIINLGIQDPKKINANNQFIEKHIKVVDKIIDSQIHPIIFFNTNFEFRGIEADSLFEGLKDNIRLINTFSLNEIKKEINFTKPIIEQIGRKIKGIKVVEQDSEFYNFKGVNFPSWKLISKSKALCSSIYYGDQNKLIDGIYPYHQYDKYLFQNCPLTIVNEYLDKFRLILIFDHEIRNYALYSKKNGVARFIKFLDYEEKENVNFVPIDYENVLKFRTIEDNEFLDGKEIFAEDSIFIINTSFETYLIPGDTKRILSPSILASEIYTLLKLSSKNR
jgi:hypothetical protein